MRGLELIRYEYHIVYTFTFSMITKLVRLPIIDNKRTYLLSSTEVLLTDHFAGSALATINS